MSNTDIQKINTNEDISAETVFNKVVNLSGRS
ncbi:RidA family protein, partial [Acinetobacter baumannii]|nr:RidA family protein [Acinetobacter baumannii]